MGEPFIGRSGNYLHPFIQFVNNILIDEYIHEENTPPQFAFSITNLVGCRPMKDQFDQAYVLPYEEHMGESLGEQKLRLFNRQPTEGEIKLCLPHITEVLENPVDPFPNWPYNKEKMFKKLADKRRMSVLEQYEPTSRTDPTFKFPSDFNYRPYRGIVYLGQLSEQYFKTTLPSCSLHHPANVLRKEFKLLTMIRQAKKLADFIKEL